MPRIKLTAKELYTDAEYGYRARTEDWASQWYHDPHKAIAYYEKAIESMPDKYRKKLVPIFKKHIQFYVGRIIDGS